MITHNKGSHYQLANNASNYGSIEVSSCTALPPRCPPFAPFLLTLTSTATSSQCSLACLSRPIRVPFEVGGLSGSSTSVLTLSWAVSFPRGSCLL